MNGENRHCDEQHWQVPFGFDQVFLPTCRSHFESLDLASAINAFDGGVVRCVQSEIHAHSFGYADKNRIASLSATTSGLRSVSKSVSATVPPCAVKKQNTRCLLHGDHSFGFIRHMPIKSMTTSWEGASSVTLFIATPERSCQL